MAVELAQARPAEGFEPDPDVARLRAALDVAALVRVGYDPERQVFAPGAEHPIFGFGECVVANCTAVAVHVNGLCGPCWRRWRAPRSGALTLEEFVAIPRLQVELGRKRQLLCRVCCVPGFERPAAGPHGLCLACACSYHRSGVAAVDEWIAGGQHRPGRRTPRPPAQPRPTYGRCDRCGRLAAHPRPLSCQPCRFRWREVGQPDWATYCREHPMPVTVDGRILALGGVAERLRLEFLLGLQDALVGELKFNAWGELTRLAARLTKMGVHSGLDVERSPIRTPGAQMLLPRVQWSVERALVDPGEELARDVWRLGLVRRDGGHSRLDLTQITQPWLREIFRDWARESLGTRNAHYLRATLCQIRRLSESLRTRPDAGIEMTAVGRADIENFLMRLAGQASAGAIQNSTQVDCVIMVRSVLRRARDRGLTAPGGPLEGLPDTFALYESDTPQKVERDPDDEIGRSLPNTVIKQLTSPTALARLAEQSDQNVADATELLIRTGRRPAEICHLRQGCLQWDERVRADGTLDRRPVLVYRPEKTPKRSKRLPVHAREALIIKHAQERARARFPDVAAGKLPLFPRGTQNRSGTVPISAHRVVLSRRTWPRSGRRARIGCGASAANTSAPTWPISVRWRNTSRICSPLVSGSSPQATSWPTRPAGTRCPPMSTSVASGT